jgi:2-dehydropantoate 2-reductase
VRFIVFGAGAVGGVMGARLGLAGSDVVLIARGGHAAAIRQDGLVLESPEGTQTVPLPVAESPAEVAFQPGDVVLLTVKSQDTAGALGALAAAAPPTLPVVCYQNGVENERLALRLFSDVYAGVVMSPTAHLVPGVVQAFSSPCPGIFDLGRYPTGSDDVAEGVARALAAAGFEAVARPDIMRWKYSKLLMNLGNVVEAACGPVAGDALDAVLRARAEGQAVLAAAGIDAASDDEDAERRGTLVNMRPVGGERRGGGSTWQSLARGSGSVETPYLNGEIVLLGRLHGVPTPVNEVLLALGFELARTGAQAGSLAAADLLARLP